MKKRICKRCDHKWYQRTSQKPTICPHCKSPKWELAKSGVSAKALALVALLAFAGACMAQQPPVTSPPLKMVCWDGWQATKDTEQACKALANHDWIVDRSGESHPSGDGCNHSSCMDAACRYSISTAMACAYHPSICTGLGGCLLENAVSPAQNATPEKWGGEKIAGNLWQQDPPLPIVTLIKHAPKADTYRVRCRVPYQVSVVDADWLPTMSWTSYVRLDKQVAVCWGPTNRNFSEIVMVPTKASAK